MPLPKRPIAAVVRWLRQLAGRLASIEPRLRETQEADYAARVDAVESRLRRLGILDRNVARMLDEMRSPPPLDEAIADLLSVLAKQSTRWADRLDGPPFRVVDDDEITAKIDVD